MGWTVYKLEDFDQWDAVVRSFATYDVYWLSGYVKGFRLHGDGEPLLFLYEDKNVRGINVVMKRDIATDCHFIGKIPENTYFDLVTPYGYGGWLIEGEKEYYINLFTTYQNWCIENNIVTEFVRYHPVIGNCKMSDMFYEVITMGNTIAMDLTSPEIIWENIISKNRNMIRKAQKNGIQIYHGNYPEIYQEFRHIYNQTMDKDNANSYYYFDKTFYDSVLHDLSENAQVFYAVWENKIIAASIMLVANGYMNYHLSGSVREFSNLAPSNLLLFKAALWGNMNGCKTLHMGGGVGSKEDSLFKFKKAFNRNSDYQFCVGRKVFNDGKYDFLTNLRIHSDANFDKNTCFFPNYRG